MILQVKQFQSLEALTDYFFFKQSVEVNLTVIFLRSMYKQTPLLLDE